jgi:hypothetical protein
MYAADLLQCGLTPAAAYPQIAIPHENLCDDPLFTGCANDGRFARQAAADPLWKVSDRAVRKAVPF